MTRQVDDAMCRLLVRTSVTRWRLLSSAHVARLRIAAIALVNCSIPRIARVLNTSSVEVNTSSVEVNTSSVEVNTSSMEVNTSSGSEHILNGSEHIVSEWK